MPFVDPDNSQYSTDVRKIFVGRDEELEFFVQSILKLDKPTHNIISISGDAGVGKSTLLAQFIDMASVPGFKEYCLKAQVGERQVTPISMMEKFADQLHISGYPLIQFEAALHKYRNTISWLLAESEAQLRDKSLESVNLPFYAIMSEDEETKKSGRIDERFMGESGHHYFKDNEQKDNQIGELTKVFVDDLNQLANTPVVLNSHHNKHQRRILLFFDTFEQLANEAVPWLLDHLLEYEISRNIVLIVAGRVSIERSAPQYLRRWLPYRDSNSIYSISLESFSQEETSKYLAAQNITDPNRIARMWKSSKGLPLYLCLLVSNPLGDIDPTKEVVDIFLSGISENEEMKRRLALDLSLSSKPFNQDDLEAFTYLNEDARPKLYRWLTTQFFVSSNLEDGRYSYHELTKEIFSRYLYQAPKQCQATRKALADYYQRSLDKIPMDRTSAKVGKEVNCSPESLELVLALVTQLLLLPDEIEHISAIEHVLLVYRHTNREQDGEIMKVLRQLSCDDSINRADADARQVASRLLQYIEADQTKRSQESLAAASYLLEKRTHKASFQLELAADIYHRRGQIYFRLDKNEQALDECHNALKCDVEYLYAYLLRGRIYIELRRYQDALIDLNHALKLKPENAQALFDRGRVYRLQGNYEEALQDFGDVLELDSHYEHQGYEEMGLIFHSLKRYKEAIDSFVKALNADSTCGRNWISLARTYHTFHLQSEIPRLLKEIQVSKSSSPITIACRAMALSDIGCYSDALEEFTQLVKRAPKNADFLIERGKVYNQLARYEDALADLSYALELKPSNIRTLGIRGHTYRNLDRYEEALQDFQRAIRLSSKDGWLFLGRGMVNSRKGSSKEALQDFEHAIELDPDLEHEAQKERGLVLQSLKKYPEAVEAFTRALKISLACAGCWRSLARTYKASYPQNEIPKLLQEIAIPDTDKASVIACRGDALRVIKCNEEALSDFEISIDLDPEDAFAYFSRGLTYYSMNSYEEALQDFYYTTKLDPDKYNHGGFHWSGMTLQALGMYKEAIESFIRALSALPTCSGCWTLLLRTYEALYMRSEIPKLLREVALPDTDSALAIINRAEALRENGYLEDALRDFTLAIEIEPDNIEAFIHRGSVYSELKRYEEALVDFSHTIELKTNFAQAFLNRGRIYRHLGRYEEALRDFDHTVKLDPEFKHDCQNEKGLMLYSQAKYQRAIEAFIKSLTTNPTCTNCWVQLAKTYEAIYPRSEIPKLLRMISISDTSRTSIIYSRVVAMSRQGFNKEALDDLERIKISDRDSIKNYYTEKGLIFSYLGKYTEAVESYMNALKQAPNYYRVLYNIAVVMIRLEEPTETQKSVATAYAALKAIQYTDEHGSALYGLGGLEALRGDPDRALDYLQQALLIEGSALDWARHDIAWRDLRESPRFQALISDNSKEVAYSALKDQLQHIEPSIYPKSSNQSSSLQSASVNSNSGQLTTGISLTRGNLEHVLVSAQIPTSLQRKDINRLTQILAKYAANSFEGSRRFFKVLVSRTDLPQRWIQETADVWTGNANHDAENLINWSISKGTNPNNSKLTTLGSLLQTLLPDIGLEDAKIFAALIVVYHLFLEKQMLENIAIRYQIPQVYPPADELADMSTSGAWQGPLPTNELQFQSWLKPEPDMLDVGLLIRAIQQSSSVCRVELPQLKRYGTGFLIAPNLLLTNYHVLKFSDKEDLEENACNALLRFGFITSDEDIESEGQIFKLSASKSILQSSPTDQLDYVLLRVEDEITLVSSIKHIQYDLRPLNEHMGMHILQHPEGETMKLAINMNGIVRIYPDRGLIQYVTKARTGSSGAPCFNEEWKMVALHHAERSMPFGSVREGILFSAIFEEIKQHLS